MNTQTFSDEDKITAENVQLKDQLTEKSRQIEFLQEMVEMDNAHATENASLRQKVSKISRQLELPRSILGR